MRSTKLPSPATPARLTVLAADGERAVLRIDLDESADVVRKQTRRGSCKLLDHGTNRLACRVGDVAAVLVGNEFAHALAIETSLNPDTARLAVRCIQVLRAYRYLDEFGVLALAFQDSASPSREAIAILRDGEVYLAADSLTGSAESSAWAFLTAVALRMSEVKTIV